MPANGGICFGPYRLPGPQGPLQRGDAVLALQPKPLAVLWSCCATRATW